MKRFVLLCAALLAAGATSCDSEYTPEPAPLISRPFPITNGTKVTGNEYPTTVALALPNVWGVGYRAFCTGTLISPTWVLTAGHCVYHCSDDNYWEYIENEIPYAKVLFGNSQSSYTSAYEIAEAIPHPQFQCSPSVMRNDIALVRLKKKVPSTVAKPTLPMPPSLDVSVAEVDSTGGVTATTVGFGQTDYYVDDSSGVKYKTTHRLYAYCPLSGSRSKNCSGYYTSTRGFMYIDGSKSDTCHGDSGGPTFINRKGTDYVAGVTSFGFGACNSISGFTIVSNYYDFISQHVTDISGTENCTNGKDDNFDGLTDCEDPQCAFVARCQVENCTNGIDDNDNNLIDCADPQCSEAPTCVPENCTNGQDDNKNGLTDCDDPQCADARECQDEICGNGIDDNLDGLTDCEDVKCAMTRACIRENCTNKIDDDGDGFIDCRDPECAEHISCQVEICDNGNDDNGNNLIDCKDPQCKSNPVCIVENCTNGIDDNKNGLLDCADPQCATNPWCLREVCDDDLDNDHNGMVDCDDPACTDDAACSVESKGSDCSAASRKTAPAFPALLLVGALAAGLVRRRRRE